MTDVELLRSILQELGLDGDNRDRLSCLKKLNGFLLQQAALGNDVVLIIDEAQNLSFELFEQVRMLSNLETDQQKLLQIVLVGQPELRDKLNDPKLRQLRQRITVRYHLDPLSRKEVDEYITHRVHVSGGNGQPKFTWGCRRQIFKHSKGIPRMVNAICDKTLLCGFVDGTVDLQRRHVIRAVRDLRGEAA